MPAWLGPAIIGGSTLISGLLGKSASDSAAAEAARVAEINAQIARENLEFQKVAREEGMEIAMQLLQEGRLGQTDAAGNRTRFVEGEGWVTQLTPQQALMQELTEQEMIRQGSEGADRANQADERMARGAQTGERMFRGAASDINTARREPDSGLADLLYAQAMGASGEVLDRVQSAALNDLQQRGGPSGGDLRAVFSGRAREGAKAAANAKVQAELAARAQGEQRYNSDIQNAQRTASTFGPAMAASPNFGLTNPTGPGPSNEASNFGSQLISAARMAPSQDYITPNYGESNAQMNTAQLFQSGGNALGSYFMNQNNNSKIDEIYKGLQGTGAIG